MFENNIIVFKFVQDLHFYVTGGEEENELILAYVLQGFFDAVDLLLRYTLILVLFTSFHSLEMLCSFPGCLSQRQCGEEGGTRKFGSHSFMP